MKPLALLLAAASWAGATWIAYSHGYHGWAFAMLVIGAVMLLAEAED